MTDLDLLTGTVAARLRLLPGVVRLYPSRTGLDGIGRTVAGLLDAVADDSAVAIRPVGDAFLIEATVGITARTPARETAAAIYAAIRSTCAQSGVSVDRIRLRVTTVE